MSSYFSVQVASYFKISLEFKKHYKTYWTNINNTCTKFNRHFAVI